MRRKIPAFEAGLQITVLVIAIIAFSYFAHESFSKINLEPESRNELSVASSLLFVLKVISNVIWSERTLVSALDFAYTCVNANDGRVCVEFSNAEACAANCNDACIPAAANSITECEIGTCYDNLEGTCAIGSMKATCEGGGGIWFDDPNGNIIQCRQGCCLSGGNARFFTERQCERSSALLHVPKDFRPEIMSESACLSNLQGTERGACLLGKDQITQKNLCSFTTRSGCTSLSGSFYADTLCSAAELDTICEKQATTSCIPGKAEIYWFDSCGNVENIYSADRVLSWNNGRVLRKSGSCSLGSAIDSLANQGVCGNCEYVAGSTCGEKTVGEKLDDNLQDVVCRDLSCDEDGDGIKDRKQGESWCVYEGTVGLDNGRSADTPGSRHYRKYCINGDIRFESCEDYRKAICVESREKLANGKNKSEAVCKPNDYDICLRYNFDQPNGRDLAMLDCTQNPDCFVKTVDLGGDFVFSTCAPRYSPGFDLQSAQGAQIARFTCSLGTKKCTIVYKKSSGRWTCTQNCRCRSSEFAAKMNDLCMSLGDCGISANYNGTLTTGGYNIIGPAAHPDDNYINEIRSYSEVVPGQYIEAEPNYTDGLPGSDNFGEAAEPGWIGSNQNRYTTFSSLILSSLSFLAVPYGWIATIIIIVVVLVVWITVVALGIGEVRNREVTFECYPWRQPSGGQYCENCGKDGLPCSQYKCQSLGATCKFVNEGTTSEACIDYGPNDASPPVISPLDSALSEGYVYANPTELGVELKSSGEDGCIGTFTQVSLGILLDEAGSCRYSQLPLQLTGTESSDSAGISPDAGLTDEQFTSLVNTQDVYYFDAGIIKENHTETLMTPSANSLGIVSYDPSSRADLNLYIRCMNANGYENKRDYVIKMCIKPGLDLTAPTISVAEPATNFVKYGATSQLLKVYTNEPANCRWSKTDKEYTAMENQMACPNNITDFTIFGWGCESMLPITSESGNTFYIRCEDKPWESNSSKQNRNTQSRALNLTRTSKLEIVSASPNNQTLTFGTPISSIPIEARTSGGMSTGASCLISFDNIQYLTVMTSSLGGTAHLRTAQFASGDKKLGIRCTDSVNNVAQRNISFKVILDSTPPVITRIYYNAGVLYIKTNEPATCALSQEKCDFNFANGTLMSGTGTSHDTVPKMNTIYYVKCKDPYDNSKGTCDSKLKVFGSIAQEL